MSGGAREYTMDNMVNSSGVFYSGNSGFNSAPDAKYYDKYTYGTSYTTYIRGKLCDATKETLTTIGVQNGGWYDDYSSYAPEEQVPWIARGSRSITGLDSGVFAFIGYSGNNYPHLSFRIILTPTK